MYYKDICRHDHMAIYPFACVMASRRPEAFAAQPSTDMYHMVSEMMGSGKHGGFGTELWFCLSFYLNLH